MKHLDFNARFKETLNKAKEARTDIQDPDGPRFFSGLHSFLARAANISVLTAIIAVLLAGAVVGYEWYYQDKFYPGTTVAGIALGGQTFKEAQATISQRADYIEQYGIPVRYQDTEFKLVASPVAASPDLTFDLFAYDIDATLVRAWREGRNGNPLQNGIGQLKLLILSPNRPMVGHFDRERVTAVLQTQFSSFEQPAQDATIDATAAEIIIKPETAGNVFSYTAIVDQVEAQFYAFATQPVGLQLITAEPQVTAADLTALKGEVARALELAPIQLETPTSTISKVKDAGFTISRDQLAGWLGATVAEDGTALLDLKLEPVTEWLASTVAPTIDIEPVNAKFAVTAGKVSEFKASSDGYVTDVPQTIASLTENIRTAVAGNASSTAPVAIAMREVKSTISNENVNDLGITELLGTGHSNFSGSPANRRHNIRVGAASVNGTLLAPDEEFSLLKVLGAIDATTGYLPELVIKGNQTIPEYGGGLCQIGTTVFRGTIRTGLPVTARRNHSYRVSYYEPAGTDATIYDPAPDYKFKNDTGHYILIQSRIEGDNLYFDFWGTKDGRVAQVEDPVIYNITPPAPTKLIETTDLAPGVRKCTERAHSGADAYFDYAVTYPDGEKKETRFTSHYRPWQEVCLIGVAPTAAEPGGETVDNQPVEAPTTPPAIEPAPVTE